MVREHERYESMGRARNQNDEGMWGGVVNWLTRARDIRRLVEGGKSTDKALV